MLEDPLIVLLKDAKSALVFVIIPEANAMLQRPSFKLRCYAVSCGSSKKWACGHSVAKGDVKADPSRESHSHARVRAGKCTDPCDATRCTPFLSVSAWHVGARATPARKAPAARCAAAVGLIVMIFSLPMPISQLPSTATRFLPMPYGDIKATYVSYALRSHGSVVGCV